MDMLTLLTPLLINSLTHPVRCFTTWHICNAYA